MFYFSVADASTLKLQTSHLRNRVCLEFRNEPVVNAYTQRTLTDLQLKSGRATLILDLKLSLGLFVIYNHNKSSQL